MYTTRDPATATLRLTPVPIMGISTAVSSRSSASAGIPVLSLPSTMTVRRCAAGRLVGRPGRLVGQFHADHRGSAVALTSQPPAGVAVEPVHT